MKTKHFFKIYSLVVLYWLGLTGLPQAFAQDDPDLITQLEAELDIPKMLADIDREVKPSASQRGHIEKIMTQTRQQLREVETHFPDNPRLQLKEYRALRRMMNQEITALLQGQQVAAFEHLRARWEAERKAELQRLQPKSHDHGHQHGPGGHHHHHLDGHDHDHD